MIPAYPLHWPEGWKRTQPGSRVHGRFNKGKRQYTSGGSYTVKTELSVSDGTARILSELELMGVDRQDVVISTNVKTRLDGMPRSGEREPDDPGVAVYWLDSLMGNEPRCMAVDIYKRVADNLAAIAATIDAMRAIERHGGAQILSRVFKGFTALPAPGQVSTPGWRVVFGFSVDEPVTPAMLDGAYKTARSRAHPDHGGNAEDFHAVQKAYEQARAELT